MTGLRRQVFRGGAFLAGRHAIGAVIGAGGVVLLTRQIGPADYGLLVAALGIFAYASFVAPCGLDVYLVRREGTPDEREFHVVFTLLLIAGVSVAAAGMAAAWLLQRWSGEPGVAPLAMALFAGLPLTLLAMVPAARLERALDYRRLARIELSGVIAFQAVTLSAAFGGLGAWSGVIGWWAQQLLSLAMYYRAGAYRPRVCWDRGLIRAMLTYGLGYATSVWVWQLRTLVNPLIVLPLAGAAAVGYVGLAIKVVDALSVMRSLAGRLSIAALARLNGDRPRALAAMSDGMRLQVLAVGATLAGFAVTAPYVMPWLFREQWPEWQPALTIFPYLAAGAVANTLFSLHGSVLYVLGRSWLVTLFNSLHVAMLMGAALYFVPRYGPLGLGFAEGIALLSYGLLHLFLVRVAGSPAYGVAALWAAAAGMLLFVDTLGWAAWIGVVIAALWPATWRTLNGYIRILRPQQEVLSHA